MCDARRARLLRRPTSIPGGFARDLDCTFPTPNSPDSLLQSRRGDQFKVDTGSGLVDSDAIAPAIHYDLIPFGAGPLPGHPAFETTYWRDTGRRNDCNSA